MKKLIALILAFALITALAGCAGTTVVVGNCTCPPERHEEPVVDETPVPAEGALKTGLSVITSLAGSQSATAEEPGAADYDVTIVAVLVDDAGIIRDCIIDSVGTTVKFDATGAFVDYDPEKEVLTKNELGDAYGMKAIAYAKYEWYEQAAAVAEYAVGKTADELANGAVNAEGKAADADLATVATIRIGAYVDGIVKAVANAKHLGAQSGDELKLAVINTLSATPAGEADGTVELTMDVTAITMNGETITSCYIDALQAPISFNASGALPSDIDTAPLTKNEKGDAYGMKAIAYAKYEWFEQAENFGAYVTGKTAADVAGISVTENKPSEGTDLAASVTIKIDGFQALIAKATE